VRRFLIATACVGAAALSTSAAATPATAACRPTVSAGGGPFATDASPPPRRSRIGRGHVLAGRILRYPDCAPIRGALVELWQASKGGGYDRRGHGSVITDRTGRFRFEGPVPPREVGRPPHIHVHVSAAGFQDFVTTYFVARGERQRSVTIVLVSDL